MSMQVTATNPTTAAVGSIAMEGATPSADKKTLGQEDFLKLLTTQLSAQDPMDPMKDTDFIAQMAQFSSLQQSNTLNTTMGDFVTSQKMANAGTLVGHTVTLGDASGTIAGKVDAAMMQNGVPSVVIGGVPYDASLITKISS